jgi:secreted PhoX family phosphatase
MNHLPATQSFLTRSQTYEESENVGRNASANPTIGDVIAARFSRRDLLKGVLGVTAIAATVSPLALIAADRARAAASAFAFNELEAGIDDKHHVAEGYDADILIRWGDPVLADAPAFDPLGQSADAQSKQFGYNNDYVGYLPYPGASDPAAHGLLCVNHEYTNAELMFPNLPESLTADLVAIEMAAMGVSVIEIERTDGKWRTVPNGKYNRRITAETPAVITGPAAGTDRMKTSADPTGTAVKGTINNCAGGITPWGTYLTAEENFHGYFSGELKEDHPEYVNYKRYGVPEGAYEWGKFHDRFDVNKERTRPTASAGSSRSIRSTRPLCRRNGPRSAAPNTKERNRWSPPAARWSSIAATMNASTTSTSSSPRANTTPAIERPTWTSSTRARSMSRDLTPTAP